jgi:hypothetical protein
MEPVLPEAEAFLQLDFLTRQVDATRAAGRLGGSQQAHEVLEPAAQVLAPALEAAKRLRASCGYCWVSLAQVLGAA